LGKTRCERKGVKHLPNQKFPGKTPSLNWGPRKESSWQQDRLLLKREKQKTRRRGKKPELKLGRTLRRGEEENLEE